MSANAIKRAFPNCRIIMCWFHLKQNIKKQKNKKLPSHKYYVCIQEKIPLPGMEVFPNKLKYLRRRIVKKKWLIL